MDENVEMESSISDFLKTIETAIKSENYKSYSNVGQKFVAWYLITIYRQDPVAVRDMVTDGANDKGIDAVYVDDDSQLIHIIQGKYSKGSIDTSAVEECMNAAEYLGNLDDLETNCNEKLRNLIPSISAALDDGYTVKIELITTGSFTDAATQDGYSFSENLEKKDYECEFDMLDASGLADRYEASLIENGSNINHVVEMKPDQFIQMTISGVKVVIVALPLSQCIKFPGIKNGQLFRKNVRQSLGNNKVNSALKRSLREDPNDFFFMHNGITAICSEMTVNGNKLSLKNINIVNGCQSMTSFYSSSQTVKKNPDLTVLFRFYEIPDNVKAEKISLATNAQSPVKPRDMRSVDKSVLAMKQQFEAMYKGAKLITKRGEKADSDSDPELVIDLPHLGKMLMTWNMQRPIWAYSEQKIFDDYFLTLFGKKRAAMNDAENIRALSILYNKVKKLWDDKALDINEVVQAKPRYFIFDHIYAIRRCISSANNKPRLTPKPSAALEVLEASGKIDFILKRTAKSISRAYEKAYEEAEEEGKPFNVDNWYKNKKSLNKIDDFVDNIIDSDESGELKKILKIDDNCFYERWQSTND